MPDLSSPAESPTSQRSRATPTPKQIYLHVTPPTENSEEAERAGDDLKPVLDSNLISTDAYEAGLVDEYDDFLELRAETIHRAALELTNWPKV